jgi:hypothetical protein
LVRFDASISVVLSDVWSIWCICIVGERERDRGGMVGELANIGSDAPEAGYQKVYLIENVVLLIAWEYIYTRHDSKCKGQRNEFWSCVLHFYKSGRSDGSQRDRTPSCKVYINV